MTITTTAGSSSLNGNQYRVVVKNAVAPPDGVISRRGNADGQPAVEDHRTQPASAARVAGASVTFTVVATGLPAPTYQWKKNGVNLTANATGASYTIASVASTDVGSYTVVVSNVAGSVTSAAATLTVSDATKYHHPAGQQERDSRSGGELHVTPVGTAPFSYQWQVSTDHGATFTNLANGSGVSGATPRP